MSRRVIVTGGCGYIGSHVARAFKQAGDSVLIIDRVKRDHTLKDADGWFIGDFASDAGLSAISAYDPDIIVHCAGTSLVGPSMTNPDEYYDNNVSKMVRMMGFLKEQDKKPIMMFSSSASVYGEPESWPIKESAVKLPINPYGRSKLIGEHILTDYGRAYGFDAVIFRYFNAAGAEPFNYDLGQEPEATHIVARVLEASINGRGFSVYGDDYPTKDGTCIRDYVHVWDIATAHVCAAEYLSRQGTQRVAIQLAYNLGTNKGISNKEIVDYVSKKYGLTFVNYGQNRPGDPAVLIADSSMAMFTLGWEPKHSTLEEIVDSAYRWYTRNDI